MPECSAREWTAIASLVQRQHLSIVRQNLSILRHRPLRAGRPGGGQSSFKNSCAQVIALQRSEQWHVGVAGRQTTQDGSSTTSRRAAWHREIISGKLTLWSSAMPLKSRLPSGSEAARDMSHDTKSHRRPTKTIASPEPYNQAPRSLEGDRRGNKECPPRIVSVPRHHGPDV